VPAVPGPVEWAVDADCLTEMIRMRSLSQEYILKALLPLLLSGCAASQSLTERLPSFGKDRYREQLLAARMAEQSGELLRARQSYEELLVKYPDNVDLHHRLGVLCQKAGDDDASISYLKMAHELSPTSVEVLCDLGYAHYMQGRPEDAISVYRQAQQINPSHPRTQSNLGLALIEAGEVSAAMTTLRQAMGEADAASTVGFALAQKGDLLQARDYFTRALDADPGSQKAAEALVQIGELLAAEQKTSPSALAAAASFQADPQSSTAGPVSKTDTVDFDTLYQSGAAVKASGVPSAAAAAEMSSMKSRGEAAEVDVPDKVVAGTVQNTSGTDGQLEKLLPPIEVPQGLPRTAGARTTQPGGVLLSHTSLRLRESTELHPEQEVASVASDSDLAGFVNAGPVEGVRSLESRRRSGGLIEPMRKSAKKEAAEPSTAKLTDGKKLPPVEDGVAHSAQRKPLETTALQSGTVAAESERSTPTGAPAMPVAAVASAGVSASLPQTVHGFPGPGAATSGMQMVLIRDASGQFYYVPMLMPPHEAHVPVAPQPVMPPTYPSGIQQAAWQPAVETLQVQAQHAQPSLPQIYAYGQPVNSSVSMPVQGAPQLPQSSAVQQTPNSPYHVPPSQPALRNVNSDSAGWVRELPPVQEPSGYVESGLPMLSRGTAPAPGLQAQPASHPSNSASVGGLPLAFLRSFYLQMPADQQAVFWRDLRKSPAGSPAEQATYRELAESASGVARIEAAITMLMVFNEQALAEKMLAQSAESSDPTVQQSARTALSMLPLQNAGRR